MKRRHDRPHARDLVHNPRLDEQTAPIVLLGLIAAEAQGRCEQEQRKISSELQRRINFEEAHFEAASKWSLREHCWHPVSCSVTFEPADTAGLTAAPSVLLLAQRRVERPTETVSMFEKRSVQLSICRMRLVRIALVGWPSETPQPFLPRDPRTVAEALDVAKTFVDRALRPLFAFVDPLVE